MLDVPPDMTSFCSFLKSATAKLYGFILSGIIAILRTRLKHGS